MKKLKIWVEIWACVSEIYLFSNKVIRGAFELSGDDWIVLVKKIIVNCPKIIELFELFR